MVDVGNRWEFKRRLGKAHDPLIKGMDGDVSSELNAAVTLHLAFLIDDCPNRTPPDDFGAMPRDLALHRVKADRLARVLAVCAARSAQWPPSLDLLRSCYREAADSWRSPLIKYRVCVPLLDVWMSGFAPMILDDGATLSHKSPEDDYLIAPDESHFPRHDGLGGRFQTTIKFSVQIAKADAEWTSVEAAVHRAKRLLRALRLCKSGVFAGYRVCITPDPRHDADPYSANYVFDLGHPSYPAVPVMTAESFSETDTELVKRLDDQLLRAEHAGMSLALDRFDAAYSRQSLEDILIDLTIALECTLLCGDDQELKYRLGLRAAALLAVTHDPGEVCRQTAALYRARSQMVHEGKKLAECKVVGKGYNERVAFVNRMFQLCRAVMLRYVAEAAKGTGPKAVCHQLDAAILSGLTSPCTSPSPPS